MKKNVAYFNSLVVHVILAVEKQFDLAVAYQ